MNVGYVGPALRLANYGVGEVAVGLSFGPLIVLGAYVVQAGQVTPAAVFLSLTMGLLITGILWINEFPDVPSDLKAGKNVIVAAHGNSLRALVKHLENIPDAEIPKLEIGTGEVYVYEVAPDGRIVHKEIRAANPNAGKV